MKIAAASFTPAGARLLRRLADGAPSHSFSIFDGAEGPVRDWLKKEFRAAGALVLIGAAGIAVRLVADLIVAKDKDPAVLVIDEKGRFVIPLLSGHIGGANRLAREFAAALEATPVITTATDLAGVFAVDDWSASHGCVIDDIALIKAVSSALLRGEPVGFRSDFPVEPPLPAGLDAGGNADVGICVAFDPKQKPFPLTLNILPKIVALGAGCRSGTPGDAFERFVLETLASRGISPKSLRKVASIERKKDEECLKSFAGKYGLEFVVFSEEQLASVPGRYRGSDFVRAVTGVDNVCERAAVLAGGGGLLLPKTAGSGMTLALAAPDWVCRFDGPCGESGSVSE